MKKLAIFFLTIAIVLSLFVSCDADTAVDTTVDRGLLSDHLFETEGKYFSTLQDAVNYLSGTKALSEKVIRLTMDASGPGAVINDLDVVIDFDGHSYSFTDVTVKYNKDYKPGDEIEGTFGLKITGSSNVILRNLSETVTLEDHTDDLVMIFVEGSEEDESFATLAVEGEFDLTVQDTQYVFWGANRANIFIGSDFDDDPNLVMLNGKIAASGNTQGWILGRTTVRTEEISIKDKAIIHLNTYKQKDGEIGRVEIGQIVKEGSASVYIESDAKIHVASNQPATVIINTTPVVGAVEAKHSEAIVTESYTIKYHTNGGEIKSENNLYYETGIGVVLPSDVIKAGYTFAGWFENKDLSGARLYSVSKTEQGDKEFYAKWTNNDTECTVYYHPNGADGGTTPDSQPVTKNTTVTLSDYTGLKKTGYTFIGWNTESDGTGDDYSVGQTIDGGFSEDITLFAKWKANKYYVRFNGNGSTSGSMENQEFTYDEAKSLTANNFSKENYTFIGWSTTSDGTVKYNDGASVKNLTPTEDGIFDLYACWSNITRTITFDANNETSFTETQSIGSGIEAHLKAFADLNQDNFKKTGYSFVNWNTKATGGTSETAYGDETAVIFTEDTVLYAQWTPNQYYVKFNANGGSGNMDDQLFTYDENAKELSTNEFTRDGYTFAGWTTNADGSGTYYENEQFVHNLSEKDNVILYAQWVADSNKNYVGKVVTSNATGSETLITPVFYSQKATALESTDVHYNFYYSNDNGATLIRLYDVAASAIVAGNGNTEGSTAYNINTAFQGKTSRSENSVIYYEVTGSGYQTNNDDYASFYMYIPGDSGSAYNVATGAAGSSFSANSLGKWINTFSYDPDGFNFDPQSEEFPDYSHDGWIEYEYDSGTAKLLNASINETGFRSGRQNYTSILHYINERNTDSVIVHNKYQTKVVKQARFFADSNYYGNDLRTMWALMADANTGTASPSIGKYKDWFVPSFGEFEQLRRTFGDYTRYAPADGSKVDQDYFGLAVVGSADGNYLNKFDFGKNNRSVYFLTSSRARNTPPLDPNYPSRFTCLFLINRSESTSYPSNINDYVITAWGCHGYDGRNSVVLVRTF